LSAAALAFVGTTCVLYLGNKTFNGKRRKARRAGNGARKEIVGMLISWVLAGNETEARTVIAGSPHDPMVKSISLDLERRGYIVYIIVSSTEEENFIQSENRIDIRALWLDLTTV